MVKAVGMLLSLLQNNVKKKKKHLKSYRFSFCTVYLVWSDWKCVVFTLWDWETLKGC